MSRCFTLVSFWLVGESNLYHDSGVFYKNGLVEGCQTVKNQWGLLTGDDGVGCGGIPTWSIK